MWLRHEQMSFLKNGATTGAIEFLSGDVGVAAGSESTQNLLPAIKRDSRIQLLDMRTRKITSICAASLVVDAVLPNRSPKVQIFPTSRENAGIFLVLGRLGGRGPSVTDCSRLMILANSLGNIAGNFFLTFSGPARDFKSPWREIIGASFEAPDYRAR